VGDGYNHLTTWSSDVSLANLGVKLGTRHFYVLLGAGITNGDRSRNGTLLSTQLGFGAHLVPGDGRLFVDVDVVSAAISRSDDLGQDQDGQLGTLRLSVGWQLASHLALVGGPTYNVQTSWNGADHQPGLGFAERVIRDGATTVRMFPGFVLGLQI
jgi:hypothetical protein